MNEEIKSRLVNISKAEKRTFNDLLKELSFERMLARVAHSEQRSHLIFKGGLCLKQFVDTDRETKDIDFLVRKIDYEVESIQKMFEAILAINLGDAFEFSLSSLSKLELESKKYPGYRIIIQVNLGKTKDSLQVDIGIGDVVDEFEMSLELLKYNGNPLMGEKSISILAYPPQFIFSEKYQAIVALGSLNSRMKDYFDCHILISQNILDKEKVSDAILKTFKNRETKIQLIQDADENMIRLWNSFQKKVPKFLIPLDQVIKEINTYLNKIEIINSDK